MAGVALPGRRPHRPPAFCAHHHLRSDGARPSVASFRLGSLGRGFLSLHGSLISGKPGSLLAAGRSVWRRAGLLLKTGGANGRSVSPRACIFAAEAGAPLVQVGWRGNCYTAVDRGKRLHANKTAALKLRDRGVRNRFLHHAGRQLGKQLAERPQTVCSLAVRSKVCTHQTFVLLAQTAVSQASTRSPRKPRDGLRRLADSGALAAAFDMCKGACSCRGSVT